jgi:hypothetical protein
LSLDRVEDAAAAYRKAIELEKDVPEFHACLGMALEKQGKFGESLQEMRLGHELPSKRPGWSARAAQWVRQGERLVELDEKLPGFLKGKATPASAGERIELAGLCSLKRLNGAAARFYEQAFAVEPKLATDLRVGHRYSAACAAALAGCGRGADIEKLEDKEKSHLRGQALDWLRADLKAFGLLLEKEANRAGPSVMAQMRHWHEDRDLAGVRGPEALAKLPEAERHPWQELWNDVADLLKRAEGKAMPDKK